MDGIMAADDKDFQLIAEAKSLLEADQSAWSDNYLKALDDLNFQSDDDYAQWEQSDVKSRQNDGRPAITVDQLSQFVHQVVNDIKMNTPSIQIIPGDGGDPETAEIFKGLIRNIEYVSSADDVYDTAVTSSVKCGIGFMRVDHRYVDEEGFDQELFIQRVTNPLAVWLDSCSVEADGRDAKHVFIIDKIKVSEFKELYPGKEVASFEAGKATKELKDDDYINIAEFFRKEEESKEVILSEDGKLSEYNGEKDFKSKRKITKTKIKRYKLSGADILEETTFPGKYIPIVPVYGEEAWIEGKRHIFSLIRKSKSAQKMFNFMKSNEIEVLMKQPQAPIIAPAETVANYRDDYINPAKAAVLRYDHKDSSGDPLPPPTRLAPPQIPAGFSNASLNAVDLIKSTMGMYGASLGQRSNETSGTAIANRQREGDVATYHFGDNLVKSVTQVGRILVCAIPEIYDTERVVRIIGVEDEPESVGINGKMVDGQKKKFDLRTGKYDVKVITGSSFTTKRQESAQFFTDIVTRQPDLMQVMGDLLFKNMDFPGAPAMSERMKKIISRTQPDLIEQDEDEQIVQPPDPEKMQMAQIIQQGQQAIGEMQQQIQTLEGELKSKAVENEIKLRSDMTKAEIEKEKMQLEGQKLRLEEQKILLDAQKIQIDRFKAESEAAAKMAEVTKVEEAEAAVVEKEAVNEAVEARKMQLAEATVEQSRVNAEAIIQALSGVNSSLNALTQEIRKPKKVVRNEQGFIEGVT